MEERIFHILMKEVCDEFGIKMEKLSYDWILKLSKDGKIRYITGSRFDLNPSAASNIACDKYATYEVLHSQNIPIIEHIMIFNPETRSYYIKDDNIEDIIKSEFEKYRKIVVKPNYGCEGQGVYFCSSIEEIKVALQKIFQKSDSASLCPYYDIKTEYRTFFLDGEVKLIYGKTKPFIIGDGNSTVKELIEGLNLPDNNVVKDNINRLDLNYIPSKNEKVEISWKHNLSGGASPTILQKCELYERIKDLAIKAGNAMNIKFATIDIIETTDGNLYVLEVNSGIGTSVFIETVEGGKEIIKDIYRQAVRKMFQ